jgi:nucleotide-binding universal stress UspA family protein
MGTSPKSLGLTFFESHVSELINEISCPVLSVPHDYHDLQVDRIGYATELYDLSERIKEIIPFARLFKANIEAFHIYPVFPQEVDVEKFNVKAALSKLSKDNHYDKINLHFIKTLHDNQPVSGIREFLNTYKPDMLVMCHKPRGLFDKLILDTGTTNALVKTSPVPILALNQKTACRIM